MKFSRGVLIAKYMLNLLLLFLYQESEILSIGFHTGSSVRNSLKRFEIKYTFEFSLPDSSFIGGRKFEI